MRKPGSDAGLLCFRTLVISGLPVSGETRQSTQRDAKKMDARIKCAHDREL